jgi:hypothetical protein
MPARATVFLAGILLGGIINRSHVVQEDGDDFGTALSVYFRDSIGGPWFAAGGPAPYRIGSLLKVPLLIGHLERQSDNEAAALLAQDDAGQSLETIREVADFPSFRDGNLYLTPQHFGAMFRILFNASYLTQAASEQALELLARKRCGAGGCPARDDTLAM